MVPVLLFDLSGDLSSEIQWFEIHACAFEGAIFDIGVDGLFGDVDLRMRLKDGVRRKALPDQRSEERTDLDEMGFRDVDAFTGSRRVFLYWSSAMEGSVAEMIEAAGIGLVQPLQAPGDRSLL